MRRGGVAFSFLVFALALRPLPLTAAPSVSVSDFGAVPSRDAALLSSARAVSGLLPGEIAKSSSVRVVESQGRSELLKEQALSDALGSSDAPKPAMTTGGSDFVVVGKMVEAGKQKMLVARAVSTQTGDVAGAWILAYADAGKLAEKLGPEIAKAVSAGARTGTVVGVAASGPPEARDAAEAGSEILAASLAGQDGIHVTERSEIAGVLEEAAWKGTLPKVSGVAVLVLVAGVSGSGEKVEVKAVRVADGGVVKGWASTLSEIARLGPDVAAAARQAR